MPKTSSGSITPGTGQVTYSNSDEVTGIINGVSSAITSSIANLLHIGGQNLGNGAGVFTGVAGTDSLIFDFRSIVAGSGIAIKQDAQTLTLTATGTVSSQLNDLSGVLTVSKGGTGLATLPVNAILAGSGTNPVQSLPLPTSAGQVLSWNGGNYAWTTPAVNTNNGTVTSVTIAAGTSGLVSVTGSPITSSGTYTIDVNQASFNLNSIGGTLSVAKGGTGTASFVSKGVVYGNGTGALQTVAAPTASGQVLTYNGTTFAWQTPAAIPSNLLTSVTLTGDPVVSVTGGQTSSSTVAYTLATQPSGVTAGTYTTANITVDQYGRVTSASNGVGGGATVAAANENNGGGARIFDDATSTATQFNFRRLQVGTSLSATENTGYVMVDVNNIPVAKGGTGATNFASNGVLIGNGTSAVSATIAPSNANTVLTWNGTGFTWASALQKVSMTGTNGVSVTQSADAQGQPVFALSYDGSQTAINNLSGTLSVPKGGTGVTSLTTNAVLLGNGTGGLQTVSVPTSAGTALTWNGTGYVWTTIPTNSLTNFTISADSSIVVTNGAVNASGANVVLGLANSGVTANTYTNATVTVDRTGRVTSASSGVAPLTGASNYTNSGAKVYDDTVTGQSLKFRTILTGAALTATQSSDSILLDVTNIPVAQGGTGITTVPANALLVGNGTSAMIATPAPTLAGTFLAWNGTSYEFDTALTNVTVTGTGAAQVTSSFDEGGQPIYTVGVDATQLSANSLNGTLSVTKGGTGVTSLPANGLLIGNGTGAVTSVDAPTDAGTTLTWDGAEYAWTASSGTGSVTSVDISTSAGLIVTGGPITSSGTFTLSIDQTALSLNNFSDTLSVVKGGTGASNLASNAILIGNGTGPVTSMVTPTTANTVLTWDGTSYTWAAGGEGAAGVTSVDIAAGSNKVTVSGGPITSTGTLTVDVNEANLHLANMNGILPVTSGGTGLAALGSAGQFLAVTGDGSGLEWVTAGAAAGGTVTSVSVVGATGRVAVTGSPITTSGIINVDVVESGLNLASMGGTVGVSQGGTGLTALGTAGQVMAVNSGATGLVWTTPFKSVAAGSNKVTVATASGVATVDVDTTKMDISTMTGTLGIANGGTGLTSVGANGQVLTANNGSLTWSTPGTVTSVGLTAGASGIVTVTGGPVTTSGAITVDIDPSKIDIGELNGTLPVAMGGTGITTYGAPNQVLATNSLGTGLMWVDQGTGAAGSGTVTSVAVTAGSNKLAVTGSPITASGTINIDVVQSNLDVSQMGGTLGTTHGGTGLTTLGTAGQVLTVTSDGAGLQWSTITGTGTVTSVSVTAGSSKVTVSGGPVTTTGTITVDVDTTKMDISTMTGTLATTHGGTGLATIGTSKQVLRTNSAATGLEYVSLAATDVSGLSTVATSGSYADLSNKPTIPAAQVNSDWNASSGLAQILNKPLLATVATSGSYTDLTSKPTLATVATSGSYADLSNKPTIPAAQVNSDWNAVSGLAQILNKPTLATVATTGSYTDLTNKPTAYSLPTASATVLGGVKVGSGLAIDGTGILSVTAGGTGTVTSVNLTAGSTKVSVSGGPVTTSGSITVDVNEANLSLANIGGTVPVAKGGTGQTALGTAKQYLRTNSSATASEWASLAAADVSGLATVATSGSYADLSNKPTIPAAQVNSDWNASSGVAQILNKPTIPAAQVNSDWNAASGVAQILNKPTLATVATSGAYSDLTGKPVLATVATTGAYSDLSGRPTLAAVATSGSYTDLSNTPAAYSLPTASSTVLGGIKVGANLSIDGNGILSASASGTGTVTSINLIAGSNKVSVSGGPITTSGSISVDVNTANMDISTMTGTLGTTHGGTGLATIGTAGQVLTVNAGGTGLQWSTPATGGSGGGIADAPSDGNVYARDNGAWVSTGQLASSVAGSVYSFLATPTTGSKSLPASGTTAASCGISNQPPTWGFATDSAGSVLTITHNLGRVPTSVTFWCATSSATYVMTPGASPGTGGAITLTASVNNGVPNMNGFKITFGSITGSISGGVVYVQVMF